MLWYLLKSHDGIIYNIETSSLHIFRIPGTHMIRRPLELSWIDAGLTAFNEDRLEHILEVTTETGACILYPSTDQWMTDLRVLLKGSGIARAINVSTGATF